MKKQILLLLALTGTQLFGAAASETLAGKLNRLAAALMSNVDAQKQAAAAEINRTPGLLSTIENKAAEASRGSRPPTTLKPAQDILAHLTKVTEDPLWLNNAASKGDINAILNNEANITPELLARKDAQGLAPLHNAIIAGSPDVVQYLLSSKNADPMEKTDPQLGTKIHTGNDTPLHLALQELRRPSKKELRDATTGAPINNNFIKIAGILRRDLILKSDDLWKSALKQRDNAQATPLHMLAGFIHEDEQPPAKLGKIIDKPIIERPDLSEALSLFDALDESHLNARDENGNTPLHWAAIHGFTKFAKDLIALGANPNIQNNQGQTPLMKAVQSGHIDTIKALIDNRADVNIQDFTKGRTALHWVQRMSEGATPKRGDQMSRVRALHATKLLLDAGANPTIKDLVTEDNPVAKSPIDWAIDRSAWGNWPAIKNELERISARWTKMNDAQTKAAISELMKKNFESQEELKILLNPRYVNIQFGGGAASSGW